MTTKTKCYLSVFAMLILLAIWVIATVQIYAVPEPVSYDTYVVQSGDTLWSIAKRSNGIDNMDIRNIIDHIEEESKVTSSIYPGQIVYIPVYED